MDKSEEPQVKQDELTKQEEEKKALVTEEAGAEVQAEGAKKKKKKKNNKKKNAVADTGEGAPEEEKKEDAKEEKKEGEEEDEDSGAEGEATGDGEAKKKKKKNKKKKKKTAGGAVADKREQDNSRFRCLGSWKAGDWSQSYPPLKPMTTLYKEGEFPIGQIMEHPGEQGVKRIGDAELRAKERIFEGDYDKLRRAAEVHRQTRKYAQKFIQPGMKIMDITNEIEACNRRLIEANGLEAGIAFPTGASLNHVAAHWTPNLGDETVLKYDDVMKIDYGSHVEGLMTDCAFTVAFNPQYDNLIQAVKEATETGIKEAGIDARLGEIGAAIQETMEAYEVEIGNKTYQVKAIRNLCGHSIGRYNIHAGKSVPIVAGSNMTKKEEGEQYAIETFGSTGKGVVYDDLDCSHYMKNFHAEKVPLRNSKAKQLLYTIEREYGTLAFCRKWLEEHFPRHIVPLKMLVDADVIKAYPPLSDVPGCFTAQFEHTILLRPTCKEVITRGEDF